MIFFWMVVYIVNLFLIFAVYMVGFAIVILLSKLLKIEIGKGRLKPSLNFWEHFIIVMSIQRIISGFMVILVAGDIRVYVHAFFGLIAASYFYLILLINIFEMVFVIICFLCKKVRKNLLMLWLFLAISSSALFVYVYHDIYFIMFKMFMME